MSKKEKRVKNRSQWPEQYKLTYKLPRDFTWSEKFTQSTTDEQAIHNFYEIFDHLRNRLNKSKDPSKAPIFKKIEKYNTYSAAWDEIPFEQDLFE